MIIDSVAALTPKAEIEGDMGDSHMGLQARLMSQALRKLTSSINRSQTLVIFINQIRMKIGVMFGNPETTTGGNALKFYSSVRLDVRRIGALKRGDEIVGNRTLVKVVKNKMAPPFARAEFDLIYSEGISQMGELIDLGLKENVIEKSGSWFSFQGEKLGQGRESVRQILKENSNLRNKVKKLLFSGATKSGASTSTSTGNSETHHISKTKTLRGTYGRSQISGKTNSLFRAQKT